MDFQSAMQAYFLAEKREAFVFILPVGAILVVAGMAILFAQRTSFAWGAAVPAIFFGCILSATGLGVGFRTPGQLAELTRAIEVAPASVVEIELPRIQKVNANFRATFVAFGCAVALGLVLVYAIRSDVAAGIGCTLILAGALGLLIDGFASRRALRYTGALMSWAAQNQEHGHGIDLRR